MDRGNDMRYGHASAEGSPWRPDSTHNILAHVSSKIPSPISTPEYRVLVNTHPIVRTVYSTHRQMACLPVLWTWLTRPL